MAAKRILAPWSGSEDKPSIYHCISRVVDKRFALEEADKEKFRSFLRMYEKFSGCRVLTYCLMSNHLHLLVEITPRPQEPLSDAQLLERVRAICAPAAVVLLEKELAEARKRVAEGLAGPAFVEAIHARYTRRMHDLAFFMKDLMQRFTQWHNRLHKRSGTLWERRFKSVLVEDGEAARTMAAYIDLNPVRAGIVADPAEYRWSGYGEAVGGSAHGDGKRARGGLVRAWMAHRGWKGEAKQWDGPENIHGHYRAMLLAEGVERVERRAVAGADDGEERTEEKVIRKGMNRERVQAEREALEAGRRVAAARRLRWRLRYMSDGAVIGSRGFVEEVFQGCRERFGARRRGGGRKLRGSAAALSEAFGLRSLRDLQVDRDGSGEHHGEAAK
jgi:putative transposase